MTTYDYAMSRVRDAIGQCEGNHLKAQRLLVSWMEKDPSLLIGLAGPHLQSIISYALNQAEQGNKKPMPKKVELDDSAAPPPGKASQKHIDAIHQLAAASKAAKGKDE